MDEDGDDEGAGEEAGALLQRANGAIAADDAEAEHVLPTAGPTYTMDIIEGEWDGLLEESRGAHAAVREPAAAPAAEPVQPTEAETMALNKRQRRQEKKRLADERDAAIRQAVGFADLQSVTVVLVMGINSRVQCQRLWAISICCSRCEVSMRFGWLASFGCHHVPTPCCTA